jgi:hypothetical protein
MGDGCQSTAQIAFAHDWFLVSLFLLIQKFYANFKQFFKVGDFEIWNFVIGDCVNLGF